VALVLLVSKEMPIVIVPGLEGLDGDRATLRPESVRAILVLCSVVIIGREIAISALREWMAEIGQRGKVKVSQLAKYKTILQIVGLSCMLFRWNLPILPGFALPIFEIGLVLTVVAAFLTLWSAISYLRAAWPDLRGSS
jgi:phosphatidylglycerophosphate synthase